MPALTAADGPLLLRGEGDGRPWAIVGCDGKNQSNGVMFLVTHDYDNPQHKTSLADTHCCARPPASVALRYVSGRSDRSKQ